MLLNDYLIHHRFISLFLTGSILLVGLFEYSQRTQPISFGERDTHVLLEQVILDRQLISTLVTSLISCLCPLLTMILPNDQNNLMDRLAQAALSLGLALGWIVSLQLDFKSTANKVHFLKYLQTLAFLVEAVVIVLSKERRLELEEKH
ncbi:hypothetical protein BY458DRAFT_555882 [Sporodiniella umbellata]|nr:hypothetical protein BY458DRAFT_555882 [Sporodiniella umbellata]